MHSIQNREEVLFPLLDVLPRGDRQEVHSGEDRLRLLQRMWHLREECPAKAIRMVDEHDTD